VLAGIAEASGWFEAVAIDIDRQARSVGSLPRRVPDRDVRIGPAERVRFRAWFTDSPKRTEFEHFFEAAEPAIRSAVDRVLAVEDALAAAERDDLTGLLNRRGLRRLLAEVDEPFVVVLADLDHLKEINDRQGHAAGDAAIQELARRLAAGRDDDILCRWGGEEFLVVLRRTSIDGAAAWLRRVLASNTDSGSTVTFSAGVAECGSNEQFQAAVDEADRLLYQAKAAGRARVFTFIDR
jgi:diguanylate cyclase (GGDEF)-like protein